MTLSSGNPDRTIDVVVSSIAFALSVWLLIDTEGVLRRIFFYSRRRASPRVLRFIWIDAAVIAIGTAYLLLSDFLQYVRPD